MAFGTKKTAERTITASDQADLSRASYHADLSFTELDAETDTFTVTVDRIPFRKPLDIVMTVLEANGYATNFENLLSCFDSMVHSLRIKAVDPLADERTLMARSYMPSISFQMPDKTRVGFLLKKFYAEIEGYEIELARLRAGEKDEAGGRKQSREQLKREMERLQNDNARLQSMVSQLNAQLAQAVKSQAHVAKALESNNIIPPQLKPVLVREINLENRTLTMKAGRSSYLIPMHFLRAMPKIGDPCFLNIKDEQIVDAYFYENRAREFQRAMADVLYVDGSQCKLRDGHRRIHLWTAQHPQEAELLSQLKRGSKVIVSLFESRIIRLTAVFDRQADHWTDAVHEQQTAFQLEQDQTADDSLALLRGKD